MENVLNNGFCELSQDEIMNTEGGGAGALIVAGVILMLVVCSAKGCADADAGK